MPKVSGIFDLFDNLENTPIEEFDKWLKHPPNSNVLKNFVANRMLYPQAISVSQDEMEWELAILREAVRNTPAFLNVSARKILIPEAFLSRIPDLSKLAWMFIDAYLSGWIKNNSGQNVWTVILRSEERDEVIGSILIPEFLEKTSFIKIAANEKSMQVQKGGLAVIPCETGKCKVDFKINKGILLGVNEGMVEVYGGRLGLVVDGR